jgi:hypothetical protein
MGRPETVIAERLPNLAGRARWTLSLLANKLVELKIFDSVSASTIRRGLKKTKSSLGL